MATGPQIIIRRVIEKQPTREGHFDNTYPQALSGIISDSDWEKLTTRIDEAWAPIVAANESGDALAACLCLCCCCTLGLSCCILCCYSSVRGSQHEKKIKRARSQIKRILEEANKEYAESGVKFIICPTISDMYYEIRIAGDNDDNAAGKENGEKEGEDDKEGSSSEEEEPLNNRRNKNKEDNPDTNNNEPATSTDDNLEGLD
jgi:hypothetical protein